MRCRFIRLFGEKTPAFLEGLLVVLPPDFSASERAHLQEMKKFKDPIALWARMDFSIFFPAMCYVLFAHKPTEFSEIQVAVEEVLEALSSVWQVFVGGQLSSDDLVVLWKEFSLVGVEEENPFVGRRMVSVHAWRRFCERAPFGPLTYRERGDIFLRIFREAIPMLLEAKERYYRLLNNGVREVCYLWNGDAGLRFVVSKQVGGLIITVKKPYGYKRYR